MRHYKFLEQVFSRVNNLSYVIRDLCSKPNVMEVIDKVHTLQEIRQEIIDSEPIAEAINVALSNKGQLNDIEVANLHCISRMHKNVEGVPINLLCALTTARLECRRLWSQYIDGSETLQNVMDSMGNMIKLLSEVAAVKAADLCASNRYDVLLKAHDGDLDTRRVDDILTDIGAFFRQFFGEVLEKQRTYKMHSAKVVSHEKQSALHEHIAGAIFTGTDVVEEPYGFSGYFADKFESGDVVYCSGTDYRIGLTNTLAGLGKLLYRSTLPKQWKSQPIGCFAGSVMYEAQGALFSQHLLRDDVFLSYILPTMKKIFGLRGKGGEIENVRMYLMEVKANMLISLSDEVTSLAHVMLRYALEKELINGDLDAKDLPDAWAQGMKYYFDAEPSNDMEGCMQDDCWISGNFGYMPSKVVGAIAAQQIYSAMKSHKVDVFSKISTGCFSDFVSWLSKYIYSHGARYSSTMLLKKMTGKRIDVDSYKNYLVSRYLSM